MKRSLLRVASVCATVLTATTLGCGGATESAPTTMTATPMRARPRRRAVRRALTEAGARASQCLPPAVAGVTVTGGFEGESGDYHVDNVNAEQPLSPELRECVREAFENASVDPFTQERYDAPYAVTREGPGTLLAAGAPGAPLAAAPADEPAGTEPRADTAAAATATPTPGPIATGAPPTESPPSASTTVTTPVADPSEIVAACYRDGVRTTPVLGGRMHLRFAFDATGATQSVRARQVGAVRGTPQAFARVLRCIEGRVRMQRFAPAATSVADATWVLEPRHGGEATLAPTSPTATAGATSTAAVSTAPRGRESAAATAPPPVSASPPPNGPLDLTQIAAIVRGRTSEVTDCYRAQLARDRQLQLQLRVRFAVATSGAVVNTSSRAVVQAGSPDAADEVARCVEAVVRSTTFPARNAGEPLEAVLPFTFTPSAATESAPSATAGAPSGTPTGQIDPARVSAVIRSRSGQLNECYARAAASDRQLAGRITVRFTVDPVGRVTAVGSEPQIRAGSPAQFGEVARCVEAVMRSLVLPPPTGGAAAVALPLDFGPGA